MGTTASDEKVQVVPGVEGPRTVTTDVIRTWSRAGGGVAVELRIDYDDDERRYVCTEFRMYRSPDASEGKGFVTTETLRQGTVSDWLRLTLNVPLDNGHLFRELPTPGNVEPWGWKPPKGLAKEGPTDRALQWAAQLYRYGMAVHMNPAKVVEETLKLSHGTAARWIRQARQKGYLGPSEGPGRAAG
jgi:hypothetical protein